MEKKKIFFPPIMSIKTSFFRLLYFQSRCRQYLDRERIFNLHFCSWDIFLLLSTRKLERKKKWSKGGDCTTNSLLMPRLYNSVRNERGKPRPIYSLLFYLDCYDRRKNKSRYSLYILLGISFNQGLVWYTFIDPDIYKISLLS